MLDDEMLERIQIAIAKDGRSMRRISAAASLGENFVNQLLRGERSPTVAKLKDLCDELDVSMVYIITGIELDTDSETLTRTFTLLPPDKRQLVLNLTSGLLENMPDD